MLAVGFQMFLLDWNGYQSLVTRKPFPPNNDLQECTSIIGEPKQAVAVQTKLGSDPVNGKTVASSNNININLIHDHLKCLNTNSSVMHDDLDIKKLQDLERIGVRSIDKVHDEVLDTISFNGGDIQLNCHQKVGHKPLPSNP